MNEYIIAREGAPPFGFTGDQLCDPTNITVDKRTYSGVVYMTEDGLIVLSIAFRSEWDGEPPYNWAFSGKNTLDIQLQMRGVEKVPAGVGYPVGERFAPKQERLIAELKQAFDRVISRIYIDSGIVDEI